MLQPKQLHSFYGASTALIHLGARTQGPCHLRSEPRMPVAFLTCTDSTQAGARVQGVAGCKE